MSTKPPGASKPCNCLTFLELLFAFPEGPFAEGFDSFSGPGGSGVTVGHQTHEWGWCPGCGGRLGKYRPELKDAYRRFQAADEGPYAVLDGRHETIDAVHAVCARLGAGETGSSNYHVEFRDETASLEVSACWDPDHECVYVRRSFSPDPALLADPFVPGSFPS
jgi:hypothetical protein